MFFSSTHPTSLGTVHVTGKQPKIIDNPQLSYDQAIRFGADRGKITQLIVASNDSKPGHKQVYPAKYGDPLFWDGAVISEPRSAITFQSKDCPGVILTNKKLGRVAAFHAGRPALSGVCNVLNNAVHAVLGGYDGAEDLEALVVGSICGPCFKHDEAGAEKHIEYFRKLPSWVFADEATGALDLFQVIRHGLMYHGVKDENIRKEGPCTLETDGLASYRRNDSQLANTITYVMF